MMFYGLSKQSFFLRNVIYTDENLLFKWANDPDVRKWSFSKNIISLNEHKIWFYQKLNNSNVLMRIFEVNNTPTGLVRLEKDNGEIELNFLIASQSHGKGLGSKMLKMAINEVRNHWRNIKVFAYTIPDNIASIKSLEKAGFSLVNSRDQKNCFVFEIT